jgi:dienelactone hydrolase
VNAIDSTRAYAPTVHLQRKYGTSPACGRDSDNTATSIEEVTCGSCARTDHYSELVAERNAEKRRLEGQNLAALQALLDVIGKAGHGWANESGHCETYDEGIEEINSAIARAYPGTTLAIPDRTLLMEIRVRQSSLEAADEDEAYEEIARNVRKFITLDY